MSGSPQAARVSGWIRRHRENAGAHTGLCSMQCRTAHACRRTGLSRSAQQQDGGTNSAAMLDPRWLLSPVRDKQSTDGEPAGADVVEETPATVTYDLRLAP